MQAKKPWLARNPAININFNHLVSWLRCSCQKLYSLEDHHRTLAPGAAHAGVRRGSMEEADRPRNTWRVHRWILPFNRELTLGALAQAPLIPWRWKMDAIHWWLKRYFYGPAGLMHMMPGGERKADPRDNDYAGEVALPYLGTPNGWRAGAGCNVQKA